MKHLFSTRIFIALLLTASISGCSVNKEVDGILGESEVESLLEKYIEVKWSDKRSLGFRFDVINVQPSVLEGDIAKVNFDVKMIFDPQQNSAQRGKITAYPEFKSLIWEYTATLKQHSKSDWQVVSLEHQDEDAYRQDLMGVRGEWRSARLYGRFGPYLAGIFRATKDQKLEIVEDLKQFTSYEPVQKQEFLAQKSMAASNQSDKLELFGAGYYWAYDSLTPLQKLHVYKLLEAEPKDRGRTAR